MGWNRLNFKHGVLENSFGALVFLMSILNLNDKELKLNVYICINTRIYRSTLVSGKILLEKYFEG